VFETNTGKEIPLDPFDILVSEIIQREYEHTFINALLLRVI
jgi:hypothetical protein